MKKLIVVSFLLTLGCANTHKGRAVQLVVASDAVADQVAETYDTFVDLKIAECDAKLDPEKDTKEDAKECLGLASSDSGEKLKAVVEVLVAAQLAIKIGVECEDNPLKVPAEFKQNCVDGQKADWQAMVSALLSAWDELKPFFEAIKGAGK